ncbi:hypothetical protein PX701_01995 [Agromyces sp. H3Y2-19a]|uniref:hypothetical protein n=1 Tax=Agromyces chromiiresistens TaxID=3030835 RepID=UPI0023B8C6DD|nr:hypothetical protein [Agromyces chromiiresistens]MDF0512384.1 hypothetical protein [Agromyces chromiiresistens]
MTELTSADSRGEDALRQLWAIGLFGLVIGVVIAGIATANYSSELDTFASPAALAAAAAWQTIGAWLIALGAIGVLLALVTTAIVRTITHATAWLWEKQSAGDAETEPGSDS